MKIQKITPQATATSIKTSHNVVIIDARATDRWVSSSVQIPGATRMPPLECDAYAGHIPTGATMIVVYCDRPRESVSKRVAAWLIENGHQNVVVMQGGFRAWRHAHLPVESRGTIGDNTAFTGNAVSV
jgi:3-mercaptopyruvate sulfurtransferase SseA